VLYCAAFAIGAFLPKFVWRCPTEPTSANPWPVELDRRISPRYRFYAEIEIDWNARQLRGRVCNISRYGMFIELSELPELNASFSASLALNEPLRLNCVVHRVVPGHGVGVSIVIPEEAKRRFEALLFALAQGSRPAAASVNPPPSSEPPLILVASARDR